MLRFLKNKLSRISAAHHFYLAHSLTLSFIGRYVVLLNVFLLTGSENSIRRNKSSGVMRISFPRMNISLCRKRMWV